MKPQTLTAVIALTLFASTTLAQNNKKTYPPQFDDATTRVYKTIGDTKLNLYIFNPPNHKASDKTATIVFFFGGGWRSGNPNQFEQHCRHLASLGMVAITADYRVSSRHNSKAVDSLRDAKSAIRFVRQNAKSLGVDPNRIAAGGGSAGGHLAAAVATIKGLDEENENDKISSVPNALALFNPAVVLAPTKGRAMDDERIADLTERMGVKLERLSPYHNVRKNAPPTIIFHGMADTTVPYQTVQLFTEKMHAQNNTCQLVGYPDETHGFFNYGRGDNSAYEDSVSRMEAFLASHGFLKDKPKIKR